MMCGVMKISRLVFRLRSEVCRNANPAREDSLNTAPGLGLVVFLDEATDHDRLAIVDDDRGFG